MIISFHSIFFLISKRTVKRDVKILKLSSSFGVHRLYPWLKKDDRDVAGKRKGRKREGEQQKHNIQYLFKRKRAGLQNCRRPGDKNCWILAQLDSLHTVGGLLIRHSGQQIRIWRQRDFASSQQLVNTLHTLLNAKIKMGVCCFNLSNENPIYLSSRV